MRTYLIVKRMLDILLSGLLLMLLALPMAVISLIIVTDSRGGALFKQERIGKNGKTFVCYKFRTMYKWAPNSLPTAKFENSKNYITPVGAVLRRCSLDELPQLFNVFLGDMSIVGPRPLIVGEGEIHGLRQRCGVYSIRPGITGLAQVSGRDELGDIDKARLDIKYLRNISILEDVKIIVKTFFGVIVGKGFSG